MFRRVFSRKDQLLRIMQLENHLKRQDKRIKVLENEINIIHASNLRRLRENVSAPDYVPCKPFEKCGPKV